ncbi:MAG: SAM-dependent methyltransferase [Bacteroidia bacterium]|nr:SAM-dependent methyltransferase [Bacteroidia bacterium]
MYLIPSPIGKNTDIIPDYFRQIIKSIEYFIVEDAGNAQKYLKNLKYNISLPALTFYILNEHTNKNEIDGFLYPLLNGADIGLLSEAGCPCIADPGAEIVRMAHEKNIRVVPLVGPSSIFLALMASGLNGQNFTFNGYLPVKRELRLLKLKSLEKKAKYENQTQIFMETPYRNRQLLSDILQTCNGSTLLCIAAGISGANEYIKTMSIADWKKNIPDIHKIPAIFLIY